MRASLLVWALVCAIVVAPESWLAAQREAKGVRLADISWQQAAELLRPETVVVIPLGAGAKEHGPHLRLGNDAILAEYLTRRVIDVAADVVVAPPLTYHFYPAFLEYPGSTSLTLETARALTEDTVRGLSRFGPRRFYVLNTGVSTARALEPAARALAAQGILLRYTDLATRLERLSAPVRQQEGGTHADEVETSMMLYIDHQAVDMRRAVKEFTPSEGPLHLTRSRGGAGTFSESGVWGDPTLATREKGRIVVEGLVGALLDDIESTRRSAVPPRGPAATVAPPRKEMPRIAPGQRTCSPGDERIIRQVGDALTLAWHNADALRLALLWSVDGDMVHPDGAIERGRDTIRTNRVALFTRPEYRGSRHPVTVGNIRCVTPDTAVADGKWELRGVSDGSGNALPAFEGLLTLVMGRSEAGWAIEAYRYTMKPAAAPMPTLLKRPGFTG